jgi:Polyketide cyclase / dehydrase and lipid transport
MTIFGGWRGEVPSTIKKGTRVSSLIKVKGFRNIINWEVTQYDEPTAVELAGSGRGGVRITVAMRVADNKPGSTFELSSDLSGGLLNGPIGKLVAKIIKSDVRKSVCNLAALE